MEDDLGLLARSFAGIYVLVLLYGGRFDELKTERHLHSALPMIERLVMGESFRQALTQSVAPSSL